MTIEVNPSLDGCRESSASRRSVFALCALLLATVLSSGCASHTSEVNRPAVYRGGQYYGDAIHPQDLASQ